jgi:hypothetical protein
MIKGSFTSATGVIDIEFIDGLTPVTDMDVTQIGELSYSFDITPESVTIDRLLALYSNFKFSFNSINQVGTDIYEAMVDRLLLANRTVNLVITTHQGVPYSFRFECSINDLEIDERTGIASLLCKPYVADITFKQVFDAVPSVSPFGLKAKFRKATLAPTQYVFYDATGVGSWIKTALPLLFGNSDPVDFVPSPSRLDPNRYTANLYTDTPVDLSLDGKRMLALVDMGTGFEPAQDGTGITIFNGTLSINATTDTPPPSDPNNPPPPSIQQVGWVPVVGLNTNFVSLQTSVGLEGKKLFVFNNNVAEPIGEIVNVANDNLLYVVPAFGSVNLSNVVGGFGDGSLPNQRPALEVLKELAGIEGSVFGSGFSRNFYINRLADTQIPVDIDYANVINAKLNRTSLYLGNSLVTQLGTQTSRLVSRVKKKKSFWDKLFGRQRFSTEVGDLPDDPYGTYPSTDIDPANRQLPVMSRVTSGNIGNPRASKELRIELAPAYPLLSKGIYSSEAWDGYTPFVPTLIADGNNIATDTALESALTANGLRNYLRALSSVDGDFIIDFEIKDAFSIKPYETFRFTNAPERYQGKTYRVSEIRYNLLTDTVKVKGYKIEDFDVDVIPSSSLIESINLSSGVLDFEWDTTKPTIKAIDISAVGVDGSLTVTCSSGFYSINTDQTDNLWRNSITLNTDGFGALARRIYVRFSPSATGIVSDSLLYGVLQVSGESQTARAELRATVIAPQAEFYIGQVDGIIGGDTLLSITANMFTEIEQGREITLVGENKGYRYTITTAQDVFTGDNTFSIEPQFIEKDRYHVEVSQNADRTGITVSEREIVLKVKSDGKIAAIRLSADADSATTEINIVADQVKINDINFVSNGNVAPAYVGYVESNGYTAGVSGWRISGTGNAEFGNVVVRGSLSTSNIVGNLIMQSGGEIKNTGNNYLIDENGIELYGTGDVVSKMTGDSFTTGSISGGSITEMSPFGLKIALTAFPGNRLDIGTDLIKFYNAAGLRGEIGGFVGFSDTANATSKDTGAITTEGGIGVEKDIFVGGKATVASTTDSSNVATGSIITAGGVGIAKNLNVGANLRVLGTTEATNVATGSTVLSGGLGVAKNVHVGGILVAPIVAMVSITDGDSPYAIPAGISYVATDSSTGGITVNLPAGANGRKITIFDSVGSASINSITIQRSGSDTINGGTASYQLTNDYESVTVIFNNGNWTII